MNALDYAKRYVVYRIEEGDGPEGDDKVVVLGSYTKSYVAKAAAKNHGAEVLDTQEVDPERLADFNQKTGSEFGMWLNIDGSPIRIPTLKWLASTVGGMLEKRYGLPMGDLRPLLKAYFLPQLITCDRGTQNVDDAAQAVFDKICANPSKYLCVHPR